MNQLLGDVLVAEKFAEVGHVRIESGQKKRIRGQIASCPLADTVGASLCAKWPSASAAHFGKVIIPEVPRRPKVHVGTVISCSELIDDSATATYWMKHPQIAPHNPIGGEMELCQIAAAATKRGKLWLLAKAICDFAGLVGKKDKAGQRLAAAAAAHFAEWLLRQPVMDAILGSRLDS